VSDLLSGKIRSRKEQVKPDRASGARYEPESLHYLKIDHSLLLLAGGLGPRVAEEPPALPTRESNLVLTARKKAGGDGAVILRVFEIRGDTAENPIRFLARDRSFRPANRLEEELPKRPLNVLPRQPDEIDTVKLFVR
jgi:hypothetical protein